MDKNKKEVIKYLELAKKNGTTIPVMVQNLAELFARQFNESVKPQMPKKFKKVLSNRWQQPVMEGYLMKCCDCGLIHSVDFRIAYGHDIRDNRVQLKMERIITK